MRLFIKLLKYTINTYLEIWSRQGHILFKIDTTFVNYFDFSGYMYLECSGFEKSN